jgi:Spy/CpxP family protein refolding chaperone
LEEKMKHFPESQQQIFSKLEETYQQIKELFDIEKTLVKKNRSDLVAKKTANIIQNIERTQDLIAPPQNTD